MKQACYHYTTGPLSDYDKAKIREFEESIEYKDNSYHIKLPWHEDKISSVPSNHEVALSVLNRVVTKLENQGLWNAYVDVFKQQEEEGIIERFEDNLRIFQIISGSLTDLSSKVNSKSLQKSAQFSTAH